MTENLQFSIVIPTYNRGYTLRKAIDSVRAQSLSDWELLVVDDGSTDETSEIVREFHRDTRIRYFYKSNGGPSSARNMGLELSRSSIISYVDSDDTIFPDYLEVASRFFNENPQKSFAIGKARRFMEFYDEKGILKASKQEISEIELPSLEDYYNWSIKASIGTGFFHRKSLGVKWNNALRLLENLDFLMQCSILDPEGFLFIPHEICEYKQRYGISGLCSNASYRDWAEAFSCIYELHKNDPLMRNPAVYLDRVKKYLDLQARYERGEVAAPQFKCFPELSSVS